MRKVVMFDYLCLRNFELNWVSVMNWVSLGGVMGFCHQWVKVFNELFMTLSCFNLLVLLSLCCCCGGFWGDLEAFLYEKWRNLEIGDECFFQ